MHIWSMRFNPVSVTTKCCFLPPNLISDNMLTNLAQIPPAHLTHSQPLPASKSGLEAEISVHTLTLTVLLTKQTQTWLDDVDRDRTQINESEHRSDWSLKLVIGSCAEALSDTLSALTLEINIMRSS